VNLRAVEGDDTAYGQALFPVPANDPNDPLQWPKWKKNTILIICSLYSFLGNSALLGPSVYILIFSTEFGISPTTASGLISYPNIMYVLDRTQALFGAYLVLARAWLTGAPSMCRYGCGTLLTIPVSDQRLEHISQAHSKSL